MYGCDMCVNNVFNEEDNCGQCLVELDEDELYRFMSSGNKECPYFRLDDEYSVARKQ